MGLYSTTYKYAQNHPEEFWSEAAEQLVWQRRWDKVLDDNNTPFTTVSYTHLTLPTTPYV